MKPPPFEYHAPESVEEALALLAEHGDEAKVLAGGQSLVPLLNFRLIRPARLVDLNRVAGLAYLNGGRMGAMTRMRTVERESEVPLLRKAARFVGHAQIRNRGTVGGSCAHADPAAELPCALLALEARFRLRSARGERIVPAGEFFLGTFTTALGPDELLVEIEVPPLRPGTRTAFVEYARVHGDFAQAGVAAVVGPDRTVVVVLGAADRPVLLEEAGELSGHRRALLDALVERALAEAA